MIKGFNPYKKEDKKPSKFDDIEKCLDVFRDFGIRDPLILEYDEEYLEKLVN